MTPVLTKSAHSSSYRVREGPQQSPREERGQNTSGDIGSEVRNKKKMLVAQSCLTLCDPMDCSLPGSSVHGILQARILEWVTIPFYRGSSDPGIEPRSPELQADSLLSEPPGKPIKSTRGALNIETRPQLDTTVLTTNPLGSIVV